MTRRELVAIDQTEQLPVADAQERSGLLRALGAAMVPRSPVTVVMTIRQDRLEEVQRLEAIGGLILRTLGFGEHNSVTDRRPALRLP